jgi:hypothetical protein
MTADVATAGHASDGSFVFGVAASCSFYNLDDFGGDFLNGVRCGAAGQFVSQ